MPIPERVALLSFAGLPVVVSKFVPPNELWLLVEGKKETVHAHEGPQAGEMVETWIKRAEVYRIINVGEPLMKVRAPKKEFSL